MSNTNILALPFTRPMFAPLLQRWLASWRTTAKVADREHHTADSAASLYARAARYEATQPGFASDLRAAAEAMDGLTSRSAR